MRYRGGANVRKRADKREGFFKGGVVKTIKNSANKWLYTGNAFII